MTKTETDQLELKTVIGAILFASKEPVSARQISNLLNKTAENYGEEAELFRDKKTADVKKAIKELDADLQKGKAGVHVSEVASGYRLQNDVNCGIWLREMMGRGKPNKLSKPALETLSVIAYRQPCTRSEIEAVRGVAVDAIVRTLLELQLVKVVGRSELPGKPWLFGTTHEFLEHFGLNKIADLPGMDQLKRVEEVLNEPLEEEGEELEDGESTEDGAEESEPETVDVPAEAEVEPAPEESEDEPVEPEVSGTQEIELTEAPTDKGSGDPS